jgi:ABC-type polar amino acid transport system ATPase subunit
MNKWYGEFHVLRDINLTVTAASASSSAARPARASRR